MDVRRQPNNLAILQAQYKAPGASEYTWVGFDKLTPEAFAEVTSGPLAKKYFANFMAAQSHTRSKSAPGRKRRENADQDAPGEQDDEEGDQLDQEDAEVEADREMLEKVQQEQRMEELMAKKLEAAVRQQFEKEKGRQREQEKGKQKGRKPKRSRADRDSLDGEFSTDESTDDATEEATERLLGKLQKNGQTSLSRSLPAGTSLSDVAARLSVQDALVFAACVSAYLSRERWSRTRADDVLECLDTETSDDEGGYTYDARRSRTGGDLAHTVAKYGLSGRKVRKEWAPASPDILRTMLVGRHDRILAELAPECFALVSRHFRMASQQLVGLVEHIILATPGGDYAKVEGILTFFRVTLRAFDAYHAHLGHVGFALAMTQAMSIQACRLGHTLSLSVRQPAAGAAAGEQLLASSPARRVARNPPGGRGAAEGIFLKVPNGTCAVSICGQQHPTDKCRIRFPETAPAPRRKHYQELHDRWVAQGH